MVYHPILVNLLWYTVFLLICFHALIVFSLFFITVFIHFMIVLAVVPTGLIIIQEFLPSQRVTPPTILLNMIVGKLWLIKCYEAVWLFRCLILLAPTCVDLFFLAHVFILGKLRISLFFFLLLLKLFLFEHMIFNEVDHFAGVSYDAHRPVVILADRDAQPVLFKQINFFCPSFYCLILQAWVVLVADHLAVELRVKNVHLILALLCVLVDECLVELEPK